MKKYGVLVIVMTAVLILAGCSSNERPTIDTFETDPLSDTLVVAGDTVRLVVEATDPDGDSLTVTLEADGGTLGGSEDGSEVFWVAPDYSGTFRIALTVTDRDTILDASDYVTDTMLVEVQNYFPLAIGYTWTYEAQIMTTTASLIMEIYSREEIAGGKERWHVERTFSWGAINTVDSAIYYTISKDSIWVFDAAIGTGGVEYLAFHTPFWLDKTWDTGEGGSGTVAEFKDRGTEAGNFFNCARIELDLGSDATERTLWLAPDVGTIVTKYYFQDGYVDFDLIDYDLD